MRFNIEFQISALIMMLVIVIVFFSKKRYDSLENRIYGYMIIVVLFLVLSDIASVVMLATPDKYPWLTGFLGHIYLAVLHAVIACMCMYTTAMAIKGRLKDAPKAVRILFWIWPAEGIAGMLISFLLTLYPVGYGRHVYTEGPAVRFSFACGALAILYMLIFAIANRKRIRIRQQLPIYLYAFVELIMVVMQNTNRFLLLSTFATVIVIYIMYFTLENPDLKLIRALNKAKEEAESANRAKTMFLTNMSHEIRTPINTILGMDEMIIRETKSQEVTEYAHNIKKAGKLLLSIVNDVLDFSKIESGKMELVEAEYQLGESVSDVIHLIRAKAEDKGLEFKTDIDKELPCSLYGDEVRLRQIVMNLLTNAVKYTDYGEIVLGVHFTKVSDNRIVLFVEVRDSGQGIREEDISKLYQSFQRIDESRNRDIEGVGLGLAIAQSLLEMMDSRLRVRSTYGKGSVFSFEMIQRVASWEPVGNVDRQTEESGKSSDGSLWAPGATVLVTDDNVMNLAVIRGLLKRTGVQVFVASSGQETIALMKQHKFDVVFLDHMMPEMDGIETYREIRRMWKNGEALMTQKNTPFLILTANAIVGAREMYLNEGFDDYISKPVDATNLERILRKYLPKKYFVSLEPVRAEEESAEESRITEPEIKEIAGEMRAYFAAMSEQRREEMEKRIAEEDWRGLSLLLRDVRRNVQHMGDTVDIREFIRMLEAMEHSAGSGEKETILTQQPLLLQMWEKTELGAAL